MGKKVRNIKCLHNKTIFCVSRRWCGRVKENQEKSGERELNGNIEESKDTSRKQRGT